MHNVAPFLIWILILLSNMSFSQKEKMTFITDKICYIDSYNKMDCVPFIKIYKVTIDNDNQRVYIKGTDFSLKCKIISLELTNEYFYWRITDGVNIYFLGLHLQNNSYILYKSISGVKYVISFNTPI